MRTYSFTLLIDGPELQSNERLDALFRAGCDDALFGVRDHIQYANFDREATTFAAAVRSAISDIENAVPGAQVLHVEPEELVSLTAIATRIGKSREYVRLLAEGKRGPGGFPSAIRWVDARTRLWRWSDVAAWLTKLGAHTNAPTQDTDVIVAFNGLLEAHRHLQRVTDADSRAAFAEFVREHEEFRTVMNS